MSAHPAATGPVDPTGPADLPGRTRRLLDVAEYVTLATVSATGEPWASTLHYVWAGDPLRLFFVSTRDTTHGRNIAARPRVSGSVFATGVPGELELAPVEGAQFEGVCTELSAGELASWQPYFFTVLFPDPAVREKWALPPEAFGPGRAHGFYAITVERWWLIDLRTWADDRIDRRVELPPERLRTVTPSAAPPVSPPADR